MCIIISHIKQQNYMLKEPTKLISGNVYQFKSVLYTTLYMHVHVHRETLTNMVACPPLTVD